MGCQILPQDVSIAAIGRLRAIARSGDLERAYQELANLGYNYAELAKGVVTDDTVLERPQVTSRKILQ